MDIIKSGNARFTVFPIKYENLWKFYKTHLSTFWTVEEVSLVSDIEDWNYKLNENERFFIKNILAFFASSDGIVNENLVINFYNEIEIPEVRNFYSVQIMIEAIHNEMYSLMIDTYINKREEKDKLFNAIDNVEPIKKKAEWVFKWMNGEQSFVQRLLAFICVEGIFFSGSFCAIYWLKNRGLMNGLSTANEFIARDENLHAEFAIELYKTVGIKLDQAIVHSIFKEAIEIESEFITSSLPVSLLGMNCILMNQYIKYVADRWLVMLGYSKIWSVENPFSFMELLSANTKTNFFEHRVAEYSRAHVGTKPEDSTLTFDEDVDF